MRESRSTLALAATAATVLTAVAAATLVFGASAGTADPPGNNGTVKVDREVFDDAPGNQPHVGCVFQVDFYGFDEGDDLFADVTFESHPPTGPAVVVLTDEVFIGEDDSSGGGSEAGLDASQTYDLNGLLDDIEPHPNQGVHLKLTVEAPFGQGSEKKSKVFWVTGCGPTPTEPTPTEPTPTSS